MKRILAILLSCSLLLTGCTMNGSTNSLAEQISANTTTSTPEQNNETQADPSSSTNVQVNETPPATVENDTISETDAASSYVEIDDSNDYEQYVLSQNYYMLNDNDMLQLLSDGIYSDIEVALGSDDYIVENVNSIFITKEYFEELDANSQENIFFGYTLSELDAVFEGERFIFTTGDDGQTTVKAYSDLEEYDDTYIKSLQRIAIGTGVILICVTVTAATGGTGTIGMIFAASAKAATTVALSNGLISGVSTGVITGIQTGDFDAALQAAADKGSEGFMWGAISGAIMGGATEAYSLHTASHSAATTALEVVDPNTATTTTVDVPSWKNSEKTVFEYLGGSDQVSFIDGKEVPFGTAGSTRPDVVHNVNGVYEAVEVKNYNLESNFYNLKKVLTKQISQRNVDLPSDYTQKIVLDIRNRGYSTEFIVDKCTQLQTYLDSVYQDIPIDIIMNDGSIKSFSLVA